MLTEHLRALQEQVGLLRKYSLQMSYTKIKLELQVLRTANTVWVLEISRLTESWEAVYLLEHWPCYTKTAILSTTVIFSKHIWLRASWTPNHASSLTARTHSARKKTGLNSCRMFPRFVMLERNQLKKRRLSNLISNFKLRGGIIICWRLELTRMMSSSLPRWAKVFLWCTSLTIQSPWEIPFQMP